jgi:ribose transport system permease protein
MTDRNAENVQLPDDKVTAAKPLPFAGPVSEQPSGWEFVRRLPLPSGPVIGLLTVAALFAVLIGLTDPNQLAYFRSLRNLQVIVFNGTITGILALGMLLVIITGGIDLSVGSVVALVTVVTMQTYIATLEKTGSTNLASLAAVLAGVATGGTCGLINGLVITGLRVSPFVATLGMMSIARGLALLRAERRSISFPGGVRPGWVEAVTEVHAGWTVFNPGFWSLVVLALGMAVLLRYLVLGRYCYAIGSNEATARLCGVSVERTKILVYTLAGLLAGWAGILSFASVGGDPTGSQGLELDVIAAVVIGGASLTGGKGTVSGTLVGVFILGLLLNGVRLLGLPVDIRFVLIGAVIIVSTTLTRGRELLPLTGRFARLFRKLIRYGPFPGGKK